jgi:dihydrofolate reductase
MRLSIIVAMDDKQLIGKNNALPWHLPADLGYFKKTTTGKTLIVAF